MDFNVKSFCSVIVKVVRLLPSVASLPKYELFIAFYF